MSAFGGDFNRSMQQPVDISRLAFQNLASCAVVRSSFADLIELGLGEYGQVDALREVLPQQAVGVLVRPALPRALRVAEVHLDVGRQRKPAMVGQLLAAVPGERFVELAGEL